MNSKVIIKSVEGSLAGQEFEFNEPVICMIGRAEDCRIVLPDSSENKGVSRHHCLLDIVPPKIHVRDLGSSNGTWINEMNIASLSDLKNGPARNHTQRDSVLKDGDRFRVGKNLFEIHIFSFFGEMDHPGTAHLEKSEAFVQTFVDSIPSSVSEKADFFNSPCGYCGKDLSYWIHVKKEDKAVCPACQNNPVQIARFLTEEAGEKTLASIQGYTVKKILGEGGMGVIFLLQHKREKDRLLVLKLMKPHISSDEISRKRFIRECWITQFLKHPNIVRQYDHTCYEGYVFFTLEYCNLGDVQQWMNENTGSLPVMESVQVISQALDGLHYGHTFEFDYPSDEGTLIQVRGLVHRDIKPSNILLCGTTTNRIAKLADFGLAKALNQAGLSNCTKTGSSAGTPAFVSRKQLLDFKHASVQSDIWSLAASLYFMICGAYPRDFPENMDPFLVVAETEPLSILKRNPAVPVSLAKVIDAALRDTGESAFSSALDFKKALEEAF
ncbi:MAG: protein kinase [Candidatus Aureabacteria bacterium]|nr:protein kinase [Candidatus Auribacterota bacterium]